MAASGAISFITCCLKSSIVQHIHQILDKSKKRLKMKISIISLASLAFANEKKVEPLQRLSRLVKFTEEILDSGHFDNKSDIWIGKWKGKFATNAGRMEKNFKRINEKCGSDDANM